MWNLDFKIGMKQISDNSPAFIIAEAGINHNGDLQLAKQLINKASEAGVDAVKFQTFIAEEVVTNDARTATYQKDITGTEKQIDLIKTFELPLEVFEELSIYTTKKGLIFLSTPFDLHSVDFLAKIAVPAFKIPSGEIINPLILKKVSKYQIPIILSTGMATLGEIEGALRYIRQNNETRVILLHCVTSYPTPIHQANLRMIQTLKTTFKTIVGYSDHTLGITAPLVAVTLGAKVIEKHFTLDRNLEGPDHKASLEPAELKNMVNEIRNVEAALGSGMKIPMANEEEVAKIARRSIVAARKLKKGEILTEENLALKRPADGLSPSFLPLIIGKAVTREINKDERLFFQDIIW